MDFAKKLTGGIDKLKEYCLNRLLLIEKPKIQASDEQGLGEDRKCFGPDKKK